MKSIAVITHELDDALKAARELASLVREKLNAWKNGIGILFCDADMDGAVVTGELRKLLGIEVAGMTTLATLNNDGHHEAAAVLTVIASDDCLFTTRASEPLTGADYETRIADACRGLIPERDMQAGKPGLVFSYCPCGMPFSGDVYPKVITNVLGDTPIIGGIASDDYDFKRARVFLSGNEYKSSLVLIAAFGNIKPRFSIRHVTSRFVERNQRVTNAKGNIVYTVGDETFIEYLESFGLKTDVEDPVLAFTAFPMMLTDRTDESETPLMRHISSLDHGNGSGSFFGDVPVGAIANICLINKQDITSACRDSIEALLGQADQDPDYRYSTIISMSCCGRAMILGPDADAEGLVLAEALDDSITLTGAYCLGEICPSLFVNGKVRNNFHNCSITFCMI